MKNSVQNLTARIYELFERMGKHDCHNLGQNIKDFVCKI